MKNYVLYHSRCYDGFGAAFAAWKKLGDQNTEYLPVSHNEPFPNEIKGNMLYIVDFSYKKDLLLEILNSKRFNKIVILDHHVTAQEDLESLIGKYDNLEIIFDMKRSGALITWEYFHDEPAPMLIQYISDRDLWEYKLPKTKFVHRSLVSHKMDFQLWDKFDILDLEIEGEALNRLYTQLVDNIVEKAWIGNIAGHKVPCVNTSIAWSEVGHKLLELYPDHKFVASFTVFEKNYMVSLRSKGDFSVADIAKIYGGGGHRNAAGFKINRDNIILE